MPGTNNEATRKEEVKKIVENRRRKAELIREQQIKKRNTIIAIGVGILVVLILVMVLAKSCSSGKKPAKLRQLLQSRLQQWRRLLFRKLLRQKSICILLMF